MRADNGTVDDLPTSSICTEAVHIIPGCTNRRCSNHYFAIPNCYMYNLQGQLSGGCWQSYLNLHEELKGNRTNLLENIIPLDMLLHTHTL